MKLISILPALLIAAAAAYILITHTVDFIRTKGQSSCERCPYSGSCFSHSCKQKSRP